MSIVNRSFFVGEINIPNPNGLAVGENLDFFIEKYEPKCLIQILGAQLASLVSTENSARMTALLNGTDYNTLYGIKKNWVGLKNQKDNIIAYYIFEKWARSRTTVITGKSNAVTKSEAAETVSYADKILFAQNSFCDILTSLLSFLWNYDNSDGTEAFPEITDLEYYNIRNSARKENVFGI